MSDVQALKVQLAATEQAIYETYQRFHHQDPALRPKEAGHLGMLWTVFDQCVFELAELGESI